MSEPLSLLLLVFGIKIFTKTWNKCGILMIYTSTSFFYYLYFILNTLIIALLLF